MSGRITTRPHEPVNQGESRLGVPSVLCHMVVWLFIGERANRSMSANIRHTNEPLGRVKVVEDFLPKPEDLVFRDEGVKITIALSKRSIDFFKREAQKHGTQYQRMIRQLLDLYASRHSEPPPERVKRSSRKRTAA
jgi:hypothetical protein